MASVIWANLVEFGRVTSNLVPPELAKRRKLSNASEKLDLPKLDHPNGIPGPPSQNRASTRPIPYHTWHFEVQVIQHAESLISSSALDARNALAHKPKGLHMTQDCTVSDLLLMCEYQLPFVAPNVVQIALSLCNLE